MTALKPTVEALDIHLRKLVDWGLVAIHLPFVDKAMIDKITVENPNNVNKQKICLFDTWLRVYTNATWLNVVEALKNGNETSMAKELEQKLSVNNTPPSIGCFEKFTENIEEQVVSKLKELHENFEDLVVDIEERCDQLVKSNKITLCHLSKRLNRLVTAYKIYGVSEVQTTTELFKLLGSHYNFLDYDLLETVTKKLPDSSDLLAKIQSHTKSVKQFKQTAPIKYLRDKLEPYIIETHMKRISVFVIFKLQDTWGELSMNVFEKLIENLFPSISNEMSWYKIMPGSLCITFVTCEENCDLLILLSKQKLTFIQLLGVFHLTVHDTPILEKGEDKAYNFESALLKSVLSRNIDAVNFLIDVAGVDIDHQDQEGIGLLSQ